jgi:hypothetical protein
MARVLVACEFSGVVRRAFAARGHDAWSCDLLPAEDGSNKHLVGDARDYLDDGWDLLAVFHPPCTRLCNSGVRWLFNPPPDRTLDDLWNELREGAALFSAFLNCRIPRKCIENPVMHKHAKALIVNYRRATQTVQPHWFGDPFFKATGLYLENLPPLAKTNALTPPKRGTAEHKRWSQVHRASPGPDRWKLRSRTYPGIADAMASQWGDLDGMSMAA